MSQGMPWGWGREGGISVEWIKSRSIADDFEQVKECHLFRGLREE